jgi:hypothetical protein
VPLLSKIISGSNSVVLMVLFLKNWIGKNGIFVIESTLSGVTFIETTPAPSYRNYRRKHERSYFPNLIFQMCYSPNNN